MSRHPLFHCVSWSTLLLSAAVFAQEAPQDASQPVFETAPIAVRTDGQLERPSSTSTPAAPQSAADLLTPAEIAKLRARVEGQAQAVYEQHAPAETRSGTLAVSLAPGARGSKLQVAHGFVVALEFIDAAGNPWPIRNSTQGQTSVFVVTQPVPTDTTPPAAAPVTATVALAAAGPSAVGQGTAPAALAAPIDPYPPGSNILMVSSNPEYPFAATNLMVLLAGETRPLALVLQAVTAPADAYQDRYILSVDGYGPGGGVTTLDRTTAGLDDTADLFSVIDGLAPTAGARELFPMLPNARARSPSSTVPDLTPTAGGVSPITGRTRFWREGSALWIRTESTLLIPAPVKQVSRGSWKAYQVAWMPNVLMLVDGQPTAVELAPR